MIFIIPQITWDNYAGCLGKPSRVGFTPRPPTLVLDENATNPVTPAANKASCLLDTSLTPALVKFDMSVRDPAVKAASTLPIIDIAPWVEGHDHKGRLSTAAAIHAACLEFGFFYLDITSYVDPEEPEELSRLAHEFFSLPQEEKEKISLSKQDHARGALQFHTCLLSSMI